MAATACPRRGNQWFSFEGSNATTTTQLLTKAPIDEFVAHTKQMPTNIMTRRQAMGLESETRSSPSYGCWIRARAISFLGMEYNV
jgi:hypothetical protein